MKLDDLTASELAKLDAICLQYETDLRASRAPAIDSIVDQVGGEHAEILRKELDAIKIELEQPVSAVRTPFQIPPLQQPSSTPSSLASIHKSAVNSFSLQAPPTGKSKSPSSDSRELDLPKFNDRIGPYLVGVPIARGGMGTVFRATDTRLDREVAIKVLSIGGDKKQELNDRFEREAKAVAAISHPNVVELFDVGVFNNLPFAVMEFLNGKTLTDHLGDGRLSASETRSLGAQICDALTVAHEAGVIHRDLKPQNIMILGRSANGAGSGSKRDHRNGTLSSSQLASKQDDSQSELAPSRFELATQKNTSSIDDAIRVKVLDFGLSRILFANEQGSSIETKVGAIMGTPGFMAPEQVRGEPATASADIFALGCILYRSFYGIDPIDGATPAARFAATLAPPPEPDPDQVAEDWQLAELIQRCLSQDVADRPGSAAEVASLLRERPSTADPLMTSLNAGYSSGEMFRRRFLGSLGGAFVGAMIGHLSAPDDSVSLRNIRSLAVLSLDSNVGRDTNATGPIGVRELTAGDRLGGLLVNELSQLPDLTVQPYRPLSASSPEEFMRLAKKLNVDAFVTGTVTPQRINQKDYLDVDVQIVSSDGQQLWGLSRREEVGDNLLQQSLFATEIATKINRRLTTTLQKPKSPLESSYHCLIDGQLRSDPDSAEGMRKALGCLGAARDVDKTYAQPVAGVALVSMMLAAQSGKDETKKLVADAVDATRKTLELDDQSVDGQLAEAMIQWQRLGHFGEAEIELGRLAMVHPLRWQIQHQYGLLLLATQQPREAMQHLSDATQLNALSMLVKSDVARAAWFGGNPRRAIADAEQMLDEYPGNMPAQEFARGLLIDIYEYQEDYKQAAAMDTGFGNAVSNDSKAYFARRVERLADQPYGPFGEVMNQSIFALRTGSEANDAMFIRMVESSAPMLPLLLAVHPTFRPLRQLDRASDWLVSPATS